MLSSDRIDVPQHVIGSTKPHSEESATSLPAMSSQHTVNDSPDNIGKSSNDNNLGSHAIQCKSILQSDALYQYVLETSVYPRENPYQKELREMTEKHPYHRSIMSVPPEEAQFLMLLIRLINAKNTMELGVYTGYSLLSTALALPDDGKIIAMDMDRETYEVAGGAVIKKAGLSHKVDFREGFILPQLDEMLLQEANLGFFDFVFVDADKENYRNYHERLMKLVKVGGVIGYDNTLWFGSVADPEDTSYPLPVCQDRPFLLEFNRVLAGDERIEISQVPLGDGITLCRRIK